jgi:hypothetical protein
LGSFSVTSRSVSLPLSSTVEPSRFKIRPTSSEKKDLGGAVPLSVNVTSA